MSTETPSLSIRYMRLSDLVKKQLGSNAKLHATAGIQQSILRHGFRDGVVLDAAFDKLVAGHGRIEALLDLKDRGITPPRGVDVDPFDGDWLIPVQVGVGSASETELKALSLDHNNTVLSGAADTDQNLMSMYDPRALADFMVGMPINPVTMPNAAVNLAETGSAPSAGAATPYRMVVGKVTIPVTTQEYDLLKKKSGEWLENEETLYRFFGSLVDAL